MGPTARLPGTESRDRIVAHVDVDCFYAACERLRSLTRPQYCDFGERNKLTCCVSVWDSE